MRMKETTKTRNRFLAVAALLLLLAVAAAGCAKKDINYPEDTIVKETPQLIGLQKYVSNTETQLTMTITDAMRAATKADISIIDAASFPEREEDGVIPAGYVSLTQLQKVMPGDRTVVTVTLTGEQIIKLAERTATLLADKQQKASYVHFSGAAFVYNKKNPENSRIIETSLDREEATSIDRSASYTVAMNTATKSRLYQSSEVIEDFGSDVAIVSAYLAEKGVSPLGRRMVDKAELDSPKIVITVIVVVGVLAVASLIIVYFVMKKKQKTARAKRKGEPRIDV